MYNFICLFYNAFLNAKAARIINVNRRSPFGLSRGDGDKYEKSIYMSEYQISVELKFCNIKASPDAIYRDNKLSTDEHCEISQERSASWS